ncbi:hypothetical protein KUTeg_002201 [Tegillarca granosa]|uniref:Uncharacterized protein n=1 Tax=Tegillarca granosa TaxID=220873 RepID=A0ABQ9FTN0_TEGGR|nr:hypothetical protein KUTeg_002201 [Tegillarca granosa]
MFCLHDSVVHIGKIICDYQAVREDEISVCKGEIVQILSTNQYNLFFVYRPANVNSPAAEGWIPGHVIGPKDSEGSLRKSSWQLFKLRMQGLRPERRGMDGMNSIERRSKTLPLVRERSNKAIQQDLLYEMSPTVHQPLTSAIVQAGDTAVLTCRICGRPRPNISWQFKDGISLSSGPGIHINYSDDDVASLQISNVSLSDSGEYTCIACSDIGTVITKAVLTVLGIDMWQAAVPYVPNTSQVIGDLTPGSTYQFRVSANNNIGMSNPSQPSDFVEIPSEKELSDRDDENACTIWKSTFENDFSEIDEISRGRFAVVKRCVQKCSGQEFAAKFINRRTICREAVETEFNMLQSLQHEHLVQVYDVYEMPVNFIMVMQLLPVGRLFEYISSKPEFDEHEAAFYIRQLLSVLKYLHNCRVAHLDIKPENLLLADGNSDMCLKLIDFGDARHIFNNYYIHTIYGNPEFLAPEIISGTPVGLSTDMWSVGVVMYVLLSGVSPFLDETQEETCSNILQVDYCFPNEYFDGVSTEAKDMITALLIEDQRRPSAESLLEHPWIYKSLSNSHNRGKISTPRLLDFIERRKHQPFDLMTNDVTMFDCSLVFWRFLHNWFSFMTFMMRLIGSGKRLFHCGYL